MSTVLWNYEHRITVISQQSQNLLNFSTNTIKLHISTTNNNLEKKISQTYIIVQRTCIAIFNRIGLVDQSKSCTQIYLQKLQIAQICNLQLEFRKITPFGHAPPSNGHSGRF